MAFNVNELRSQLTLGGAKPTLFQVQLANPVNSAGDLKLPFLCKSASLPASTLGTVSVPYFGRTIKLAGDRTFDEWEVTIINDEDFLVKNAMEEWMHSINSHEGNIREFASASESLYKAQAEITQFSKTGVPLRVYQFNGLFPSSLGSIETNWETVDTIEEFSVTFQYDWWTVSGGITGNAGTE